jgi:hypothetical protein
VLRDVYDMPHEEIARELGITQTAAKVRLHRARRRLREQLFAVAAAPVSQKGSRQRARIPAAVRAEAGIRAVAGLRAEVLSSRESPAVEADRHATAI